MESGKYRGRAFLASVSILAVCSFLALPAEARRVRVAAFNVLQGVGAEGTTGYEGVKSILQRIDADVVGFEELYSTELASWTNLAAQTGYSYTAFGANGGTLSGNLYVGFFSRFPIASRFDVTSPPGANEMTRAPLRIEVTVPDAARSLTLWVMHHKSGSTTADPFRRAVEAYRIGQNMNAYAASHPERTELVMMGDLNDDAGSSSQPTSYASLPSGLPASYSLGSDITFPVAYKVFPTDRYAPYAGGFVPLNIFQVGTSSRATYPSSGGRLDYIILSTALVANAYGSATGEVYNSALDTVFGGLPKAGGPLPSSTSGNASDHLAVFADIYMMDAAVPGFVVTPDTNFTSEGVAGGPFAPTSTLFTVANTSNVSVAWQATPRDTWLSVAPTGGTVDVGSNVEVHVSLTASANALTPGDYSSAVEFLDTSNSGRIFRAASVHVSTPPVLYVWPPDIFQAGGPVHGPFAPSGAVYYVLNLGEGAFAWQASTETNWLQVSPASGVLESYAYTSVVVSLGSEATNLAVGNYTSSVSFVNLTTGFGNTNVPAVLNVATLAPPLLVVSPSSAYVATGPPGGPFAPTSAVYAVSNAGNSLLSWEAVANTNWISVVPASGALAGGGTTAIVVFANSEATNVPAGGYTSSVSFVNLSTGLGSTNRAAILNVATSAPPGVGLADDVERGTNGWGGGGLWHIVTEGASACAKSHSPGSSWYYGNPTNCTYNTGVANSGELVSATFVVPTNALLTFWSWEKTEDTGTSWDRRRVYISTNAGASWLQVYLSTNGQASWYRAVVNLASHAGRSARLKFVFDTVDGFANDYAGWYVDDVCVARDAVLAVSPAALVEASGEEGGPFAPAEAIYAVTNAGGQDLYWEARMTNAWTALSATAGVLKAEQSVLLTAAVNGVASALPGGLYSNFITVANVFNATNRVDLPLRLLVRDGLPDAWRLEHFGHVEPAAGDASRAGDDADADGMSNLDEYRADTQPTNVESLLRFVANPSQDAAPMLVWKGGVVSRQFIELGADTETGRTWRVVWTNEPPTAVTNTLPVAGVGTSGWFRINAMRP